MLSNFGFFLYWNSPLQRGGVFSRSGIRSFLAGRTFPKVENADFTQGSLFPNWNSLLFCEGVFSQSGKRRFCARESFPEAEFAPFLRGNLFPKRKTPILRKGVFCRRASPCLPSFPAENSLYRFSHAEKVGFVAGLTELATHCKAVLTSFYHRAVKTRRFSLDSAKTERARRKSARLYSAK